MFSTHVVACYKFYSLSVIHNEINKKFCGELMGYFSVTIYEYFRAVKLTTHLRLVPRSRMVQLHLHCPIHLHDVVLNSLRTGTTLPFTHEYFIWTAWKTPCPTYCCLCILCLENMFTYPLPSNDRLFWLPSSGLIGGKHTDIQTA
jgi:hypothetical protein